MLYSFFDDLQNFLVALLLIYFNLLPLPFWISNYARAGSIFRRNGYGFWYYWSRLIFLTLNKKMITNLGHVFQYDNEYK